MSNTSNTNQRITNFTIDPTTQKLTSIEINNEKVSTGSGVELKDINVSGTYLYISIWAYGDITTNYLVVIYDWQNQYLTDPNVQDYDTVLCWNAETGEPVTDFSFVEGDCSNVDLVVDGNTYYNDNYPSTYQYHL